MRPTAIDIARSAICVSVCLSLCWSQGYAVQKDWSERDAVWELTLFSPRIKKPFIGLDGSQFAVARGDNSVMQHFAKLLWTVVYQCSNYRRTAGFPPTVVVSSYTLQWAALQPIEYKGWKCVIKPYFVAIGQSIAGFIVPCLDYHATKSKVVFIVFTAQRYTSAVCAVCPSVHPSVCLSQVGVLLRRLNLL